MDSDAASNYRVFAHLNAEKALLYRAVLEAFSGARDQFIIHLRASEVLVELRRRGDDFTDLEEGGVELALQQLAEWGNLLAIRDTGEVRSVEDFYRARYLYQFSAAGEAAEKALQYFEEEISRPGELQVAALEEIADGLDQIAALLAAGRMDGGKLLTAFRNLADRFEELTSRAQTFMRDLQQKIDLYGISQEDFLRYKELLIDYLERFIGELVVATNRIAERLERFDPIQIDEALDMMAERELVDALDAGDARREDIRETWRRRWRGLERWFRGESGKTSQAEILRGRARSAIPALLMTLSNINDRRSSRSDRSADWQELAAWFAQAEDEAVANCLWRAAFGLSPARHLFVNEETLESREAAAESPRISWLEAEPIWITPRLRTTGRSAARGPAKSVIDRSAAKDSLRKLAARETEQIARARDVLATNERIRLSDLVELDVHAFDLFLDLLGEALAKKTYARQTVQTASTDGSLQIRLEPIENATLVEVRTNDGVLRGLDHWITVWDAFSPQSVRVAAL